MNTSYYTDYTTGDSLQGCNPTPMPDVIEKLNNLELKLTDMIYGKVDMSNFCDLSAKTALLESNISSLMGNNDFLINAYANFQTEFTKTIMVIVEELVRRLDEQNIITLDKDEFLTSILELSKK